MYNYVFFDLDGTITQSEYSITESVIYALEQAGIVENDIEKIKRFIGPPLFDSFKMFYDMSDEDAQKAVDTYREHYAAGALFNCPLYDGIEETMEKLYKEGRKLYMVTSKPYVFATRIAEHFGLDKYIEAVVGPQPSDKHYGKAELMDKAIRMSVVEKSGDESLMDESLALETIADLSEYVMVGDRHFDIDGACEVGIDSIGVLYGYGSKEELSEAGATYLVEKAIDMLEIIL